MMAVGGAYREGVGSRRKLRLYPQQDMPTKLMLHVGLRLAAKIYLHGGGGLDQMKIRLSLQALLDLKPGLSLAISCIMHLSKGSLHKK